MPAAHGARPRSTCLTTTDAATAYQRAVTGSMDLQPAGRRHRRTAGRQARRSVPESRVVAAARRCLRCRTGVPIEDPYPYIAETGAAGWPCLIARIQCFDVYVTDEMPDLRAVRGPLGLRTDRGILTHKGWQPGQGTEPIPVVCPVK